MARRLVAILAAEIVDRQPLRPVEEAPADAALRRLRRRLVSPVVTRHEGRVVHCTLGGLLAIFPSVVAATRAAIELQQGAAGQGDLIARIGGGLGIALNLGEVVEQGRDVYGDAIGIAERCAPLAGAGGIVVTPAILDLLGSRVTGLAFLPLELPRVRGAAELPALSRVDAERYEAEPAPWRLPWSNAEHPVLRALAGIVIFVLAAAGVGLGGWYLAVESEDERPSSSVPLATIDPLVSQLSLVVTPFVNESGDPDQEYLVDAMTDELTGNLARAVGSFVISPSTAFTFKGSGMPPREIARELGVRYAIEGRINAQGDEVGMTIRVLEAATGKEVWTEKQQVAWADFAPVQDDLAQRIAGALGLIYVQEDVGRSTVDDPYDLKAVDLIMRGSAKLMVARTAEDNRQAQALFRKALDIDHRLSRAWAGMASAIVRLARNSETREQDMREALSAAESALLFDPGNATAHEIRGYVLYERGRIPEAVAQYELTIRNDRSRASAYAQIGALSVLVGQPEKAVAAVEQAIRLSPRDPGMAIWQNFLGIAYLHTGQYQKALDALRRSISIDPRNAYGTLFLASAYAHTGAEAEARLALSEALRMAPGLTIGRLRQLEPSRDPAFVAQRMRIYEGLRKAGLPD